MKKKPQATSEHDSEIPELDDVVDASDAPGAKPPPNLDLFGDASIDPSELRDALLARISEELDVVVGNIRNDIDALVEHQLEKRLRTKIEMLVDEILAERSNRH